MSDQQWVPRRFPRSDPDPGLVCIGRTPLPPAAFKGAWEGPWPWQKQGPPRTVVPPHPERSHTLLFSLFHPVPFTQSPPFFPLLPFLLLSRSCIRHRHCTAPPIFLQIPTVGECFQTILINFEPFENLYNSFKYSSSVNFMCLMRRYLCYQSIWNDAYVISHYLSPDSPGFHQEKIFSLIYFPPLRLIITHVFSAAKTYLTKSKVVLSLFYFCSQALTQKQQKIRTLIQSDTFQSTQVKSFCPGMVTVDHHSPVAKTIEM